MLVTLRRGDAGERSRRHRVRDRGPRRRRARTGRGQRLLRAAARSPSSVEPDAILDDAERVRPLRLATRSRRPRARGRVPRGASRAAARTDRAAARAAAAAADRAAVRVQSRHHAPAARRARRRVRHAGSSGCDDAHRRARRRPAGRHLLRHAAASARPRPRPCSRSKARAAAATRAWSRSIPPRRLADALGIEHLTNDPTEIDRELWADDDADVVSRRAAVGADARHEVDVRSARHAQRGDAGAGAAHPRQHLLSQRLRRARRHAGVHGDGEAARAARRRRLRPHRRRHAADAARARLPRRAASGSRACSTTASSGC